MAAPIRQGLLAAVTARQTAVRSLSTTASCNKNIRSGCYKVTNNRSLGLTYEQALPPYYIGVRKGWNSLNTSNLHDEKEKTADTTVEDMFIRKFMAGTWHRLFLSELIIKRRHNQVVIAGLTSQSISPRKVYFLLGYSERLLSNYLKRPVKIEIQTVINKRDMMFKWI